MKEPFKVFNSFRLGVLILIILFVGWNEYSASIADNDKDKSSRELGLSEDAGSSEIISDTSRFNINQPKPR